MSEEVDRWIMYMKEHPKTWKQEHTKFIDAQFKKQEAFMRRVLKTPGGAERLCNIYNIKNRKGYANLLKDPSDKLY